MQESRYCRLRDCWSAVVDNAEGKDVGEGTLDCDADEGEVFVEDGDEDAGVCDAADGPGNAFAMLQNGHASGG